MPAHVKSRPWTIGIEKYQNKFPGSQAKVTALVRDFVEVTWWSFFGNGGLERSLKKSIRFLCRSSLRSMIIIYIYISVIVLQI